MNRVILMILLIFDVSHCQIQNGPTQAPAGRIFGYKGHGQAAVLVYAPQPAYPPLARTARIEGEVRLAAIIGVDGVVQELRLISGHPLLISAAIESAKHWRYEPARVLEEAVGSIEIVTVKFRLGEVTPVPFMVPVFTGNTPGSQI